eukprot:4990694-Ditylum_brightwellii.AAC.1
MKMADMEDDTDKHNCNRITQPSTNDSDVGTIMANVTKGKEKKLRRGGKKGQKYNKNKWGPTAKQTSHRQKKRRQNQHMSFFLKC